jgi:hypothetical protein
MQSASSCHCVAFFLSAQHYVAIALLSLARLRQCKRRHVAVALPLLLRRWQHSCLIVFIPTRRTKVLRTVTAAMEWAVMPSFAAGMRGAQRPHQQNHQHQQKQQ